MAETPDAAPQDPEAQVLKLEEAIAKRDASRELAIKAVDRHEMTGLQAADLMLARTRGAMRAEGRDAGTPLPEDGPRPHSDPALAAAGYEEPEAPDPEALPRAFAMRGEDVPPEALAELRALSAVVPPPIVHDAYHLIGDLRAHFDEAKKHWFTEEHADEERKARWGREYPTKRAYLDGFMEILPKAFAESLRNDGLPTYGPAEDVIVKFFEEKYLPTRAGQLWPIEQARKAMAAKERATK